MTITVLIADDQAMIRAGLRMLLAGLAPDMEVVAEAADGSEAIGLARRHRPDVCLLDLHMPNLDGIEATRILAGPGVEDPTAVVVITNYDLDEYVYGALRAGARGFLLKGGEPDQLVQAIRAAAAGDALISPRITARLLEAFVDAAPVVPTPTEELTAREREVVVAVAGGLTNNEIAARLFIAPSTVKTHLASLMQKTGARNRVQIAIWAHQSGYA